MRCISAAYVGVRCLSVRLSVTLVDHVKTNKHIFGLNGAIDTNFFLLTPFSLPFSELSLVGLALDVVD